MKGDVLLIAHYCGDFDGKGNNRFNYIAELLSKNNFNIELVTSDFSHNKKMKREKLFIESLNYKVTFIEEPIYKKNVSLKRFYSHHVMAKNLKKYLEARKEPNLIYCSVPSLGVAMVAAKYAKKNNVKLVIDVQDLWPEAFRMVFNVPILSNLLFYPMKRQADFIFKSADKIIAVSETYLNRALEVNNIVHDGKVVFLGTDLCIFDKAFISNKYLNKPEDEIWIAYAGTLGHSYDLNNVFDALEIVKSKGYNNLKFIIMGDGPLKQKFQEYAKDKQISAVFTGRLPYDKMVGMLGVCDIAVNPISKGAAASIINKHGDYAAAGLPVINTQECLEYRKLVESYGMGFNCNSNDSKDLEEKLLLLIEDHQLRRKMGTNGRKLAVDMFDREKTYLKIISLVNDVSLELNTREGV